MNNFLTALKAARCFVFFFFYTFLSCNERNGLRVKIVNHPQPQLHKNHPCQRARTLSFSRFCLFSSLPPSSLCLVPFSFVLFLPFFLSCATSNNEDANNARLVGYSAYVSRIPALDALATLANLTRGFATFKSRRAQRTSKVKSLISTRDDTFLRQFSKGIAVFQDFGGDGTR